ncbi:MAG: hypothetical protein HYW86_00295 [Candidatus Roizmanbacteria bacterium]|nr:MAG: hypothetical protein HYW86_00295 [Candidatus Roizmanbacteria bacterium]
MGKSFLLSFTLLAGAIFAFPFLSSNSQISTTSGQKVAYDLPYPGILPDNPLYMIKAARDKIQEFITRDNIRKAELYNLLSDKRMFMSQLLAKKGKSQLAINTLSKGEKYFLKIPELLSNSKKQGVKPQDEMILKLKLSNEKHEEVISTFLKEASQDEIEQIRIILQNNQKIKEELKSL